MKNVVRFGTGLVAGVIGGLVGDYLRSQKKEPPEEIREAGVLLDDANAPAAPHALIQLQERPVFELDEKHRPFAMAHDIDDGDRRRIRHKPSLLEEARPKKPS